MQPSTLICALLLLAVCLFPAGIRAQPRAQDLSAIEAQSVALYDDLRRHAESGDCLYIDEFTDEYLDEEGAEGAVARLYALFALTRTGPFGKDGPQQCRYRDRQESLGIAIDFYSLPAETRTLAWKKDAIAQLALEEALGKSWTEKLASAGVIVAMQDLVALHLTCVPDVQPGPVASWEWLGADPSTSARSPRVEEHLRLYATDPGCQRLSVPASIDEACYWNALETASLSASDKEPVSGEMRRLGQRIMMLPRGRTAIARAIPGPTVDNNGRPVFDGYGPALRKLIAEGCAATLSPAALKDIARRAAMGPPSSQDELIDGFE